jgi:hypothetical protein
MASRRWDRAPETEKDAKFFDLRESGYTGWIDQDGNKANCPCCGKSGCTAGLVEKCNG